MPPTITVVGSNKVSALADADQRGVAAGFPVITATDAVSGDLSGSVVCTAVLDGSGAVRVFPDNAPGASMFPVGSTLVSCTVKDAAENESPPASFIVEVACWPTLRSGAVSAQVSLLYLWAWRGLGLVH
jgi:hypothetical protein